MRIIDAIANRLTEPGFDVRKNRTSASHFLFYEDDLLAFHTFPAILGSSGINVKTTLSGRQTHLDEHSKGAVVRVQGAEWERPAP